MLLATFVFAIMNVAVKWVDHIPAIEVIFFRSIVSLIMSGVVLRSQKVPLFGNNKKVLIMRGVAGSLGLILFFTTIQRIPLASAVTLMFLSPIFTAILGIWIVKESVRWLQWVFFAISFGGIMVIQGFDERISPIMALIGVGAAFFSGVAYNMIRKLKTSEHPLVIVFYFPLVTLPVTIIYLLFDWVTPRGSDWLILMLVGVLTQIAQYFMTKAYQSEELAKVANIQFIGILYALGFGWVLFDESFDFMTYLGMTMVLVGVILNVAYKQGVLKKKN
ncbi:MAG: DMT family transporter [Roseivirga sp.]|nr:DMT family transporter [Roseivirga sp.]